MPVAISGTAVGLLPECRSASHRNVGRHYAGIVVGMDRNTHKGGFVAFKMKKGDEHYGVLLSALIADETPQTKQAGPETSVTPKDQPKLFFKKYGNT